jgi:[ribosomal protein S5]-alanine N-acetyltransferase
VHEIETERLFMRRPLREDLPAYTAYCGSERSRFVGGPFDAAKAFEKLAAMIGHWELRGFGRFVLVEKKSGRPIGHVGSLQPVDELPPEITWTLWTDDAEGKGYAREAVEAYRDFAGAAHAFSSLEARIDAENTRSRQLAERLGGVLLDQPAPAWWPGSVTYAIAI